MPTKKIYKKIIEVSHDLMKLELDRWQTALTITDKKNKIETDVLITFKLKSHKIKNAK